MANELTKNETNNQAVGYFESGSSRNLTIFSKGLEETMLNLNIKLSTSQRMMVASNFDALQNVIEQNGYSLNQFTKRNILSVAWFLTKNELDVTNNEAYFEIRKQLVKLQNGTEEYQPKLRVSIQGTGYLKQLRAIGVDVAKVGNAWIVREGDDFTYPQFDGFEITPPKWSPKSYTGKAIRVVIPVKLKDGHCEYLISERESVVNNLLAHITNNMMNNTEAEKNEVLKQCEGKTLEEILDMNPQYNSKAYNKDTKSYESKKKSAISPAWRNASSREQMIITKMLNNACKRYPKEMCDSLFAEAYQDSFDDYDQYRTTKTNKVDINVINSQVDSEINSQEVPSITNDNNDESSKEVKESNSNTSINLDF